MGGKNQWSEALDYKSRDSQIGFLEKGLGIVFTPYFVYNFSCYILLTDQISLSDCLDFLRYWAIYVVNCLFPRL